MPKVSVITVCFNAELYIEQTIKSVVEQKNCDIEYIVVDGASTDQTLGIIQKYKAHITRWISEPDAGIAEAMNKGVSLATGDYLLFLHADDYLVNLSVLSEVMQYMNTDVDIYAFDVLFKTKKKEIKKYTKPFWPRVYFKTPVMHQGAFCSKSLIEKLKGFDESLKIAMDYDFFYRAFQRKSSMEIHHNVISVMRDTGVSSRQDWPSLKRRFLEEKKVHFKNAHSLRLRYQYYLYWLAYLPYRKIKFKLTKASLI